jgi:replication fork protection complex subunit Csm3/Swi3
MSNTATPLPTVTPSIGAGGDDFGDLFDYDIDDENDPFSDNYKPPGAKQKAIEAEPAKKDAELGIDREVEITRKPRAPRVKLDENRYDYAMQFHDLH